MIWLSLMSPIILEMEVLAKMTYTRGRENRYSRLMNRIIKSGVPTKVLMLSATPVNNRFNDFEKIKICSSL